MSVSTGPPGQRAGTAVGLEDASSPAGGWGRRARPPRSGPAASKASVRAEPPVRKGEGGRGHLGGGPVPKGQSPAAPVARVLLSTPSHRVRLGAPRLWPWRQAETPALVPRGPSGGKGCRRAAGREEESRPGGGRRASALGRAPAREPPGNGAPGGSSETLARLLGGSPTALWGPGRRRGRPPLGAVCLGRPPRSPARGFPVPARLRAFRASRPGGRAQLGGEATGPTSPSRGACRRGGFVQSVPITTPLSTY